MGSPPAKPGVYLTELKNGPSFVMNGLMVVDEQKLLALDEPKVIDLFKSGELGLIYAHLISLGNIKRLMERISTRITEQ